MSEIPLGTLRRNRPLRNGYAPLSDRTDNSSPNISPNGREEEESEMTSSRQAEVSRKRSTRFGRKDRYTDAGDLYERENLLEQEGVYDEEEQRTITAEESRPSVSSISCFVLSHC